ncbi:hypothetical protein CES85_5244 [Ochrobactrum quorumnocens]|uniref:Uncharacterized protein n=1 Tax=Ochrobactrum quorumnocens TaxID=271865 RepID=A0A248UD39_9HYPH|nr:hypothetical protein CES85_5244 [[Ochrobactrum] quorumnocens]
MADIALTLHEPTDVASHTLLRSYRPDEWGRWFEARKHLNPDLLIML